MAKQAKAQQPDGIRFESGRAVRRAEREGGEWIEVLEPNGQVVLSVELTAQGPRIVLEGATLALRATESITMQARHVAIEAEESAVIKSAGGLNVSSVQEMGIHADDDVRVTGKIIWLN